MALRAVGALPAPEDGTHADDERADDQQQADEHRAGRVVVASQHHGGGTDGDQGERDGEVGGEDPREDPGDLGRARQNNRAFGSGHQRSWTLPMMYFFGTIPQWRLSELLFR